MEQGLVVVSTVSVTLLNGLFENKFYNKGLTSHYTNHFDIHPKDHSLNYTLEQSKPFWLNTQTMYPHQGVCLTNIPHCRNPCLRSIRLRTGPVST